jgi:hypothetical protein
MLGIVAEGTEDERWEALVTAMMALGPVHERRSRYGAKPALYLDAREIAHCEAPGLIDLRITRAGWSRARDQYADDPAVRRDIARRDWIELVLSSAADLGRLSELLAIALECNG